jgi:dihydrofolate reductase
MMAAWWPSPAAAQNAPVVAERMNAMPKTVFSRTLDRADWRNTTLLKGNLLTEVRRIKGEPGPDLAILGSGSLVAQLAPAGLIDELQIVVNPMALGGGKRLFEGLSKPLPMTVARTQTFRNGCVLVCYAFAS